MMITGVLALSERSVIDAELLAINDININGGLLGHKVIPVYADGRSDPDTFAVQANILTSRSDIESVFGCWSSASRIASLPYFESVDKLLWYSVQYEGQECSKNCIYGG
jgi:urea transport system substrate-binding protein